MAGIWARSGYGGRPLIACEGEANASSVTMGAAVTVSAYTGDHQSALVFAHLLSLPRPPNAGSSHDTRAWPLDPFSGGRSR